MTTRVKTPRAAATAEKVPLREPDPLAVIGRIARSTVVDAVAERIRNEILAGRLEAGSRLPSERELALALGINRLTLRAALGRLEALGLVSTRHGAGTIVTSWRESASLDALGSVISALAPGDPAAIELLASIFEVRRILGAEAVALAAERHTEEDLAELERIATEQRVQPSADPVEFARGDIRFQRALVRSAHNVGLELVLNSFARFPDEHPELVARLYDDPQRSIAFYPLVIELIRKGEPEMARHAVRQTLEAVDNALLEREVKAVKKQKAKK
jgi:GntR family transcriptional repressor for pyruvate dehydrogenase complex